jgi:Na+-translocating ferredoxin:NAD+ oxidoreductase RnfD subunit
LVINRKGEIYMSAKDNWEKKNRLGGLRRFAVAITIFNILGHTVFGFEQSIAQPLVALATAYSLEILLELLNAWSSGRRPLFLSGFRDLVDFLLSAHISGLAVSMLIYTNDRLWPTVFATAVAVCSKVLLRIPVGAGTRHFYNPSNFGITITLLLFPWVGISPPYHFTENLSGVGDWILPLVIVISGTMLNAKFTHKLPLIVGWLLGFFTQAGLRSLAFDTPITAALLPMTGVAFILYTFYMVTDPATTPVRFRSQFLFGVSVAATYGLLMTMHVVFGLFFALTIVCTLRGLMVHMAAFVAQRTRAKTVMQTRVAARGV